MSTSAHCAICGGLGEVGNLARSMECPECEGTGEETEQDGLKRVLPLTQAQMSTPYTMHGDRNVVKTSPYSPADAPGDGRGRDIFVANHPDPIPSSWLWAIAKGLGRDDLAARLVDIDSRYCNYSGEDGDVLSSVWQDMGWPMPA